MLKGESVSTHKSQARQWLLVLSLMLTMVGLTVRCGSGKSGEVTVGIIAPLSGPGAVWGDWLKQGVALAREEYSSKLRTTRIKLTYEDSQGDPAKAVAAIQKLIDIDRAKVIYGPLTSAEVLAVAPIAEKKKVVLLTPSASSRDISRAGDYIFRTYPSDQMQSVGLAEYAWDDVKARRYAVVYSGNDFGQGVADDFTAELKRLGATDVLSERFEPGTEDFRSILAKVKAQKPDVVMIVGMPRELGQLLRQSSELGVKTQFISTANIENPEVVKLAGRAAEGVVYGSVVFNASSEVKEVRDFQSFYQRHFNTSERAGLGIALAFDGMRVVLEAIVRANRLTADDIKTAMYSIRAFPGVTGATTFDKNGDVVKPFGLKLIKDGKFVELRERI
jgi:branched-chain amino acid transport system substrate-binding protein